MSVINSRAQALNPSILRLPSSTSQNQGFFPGQTTLHQWQHLASQSFKSAHFQQITNLVGDEENRKVALTFRGRDAATVINTIDKVGRVQRFMPTANTHSVRFPCVT
jgi:hypothetical protein